MSGHTPIMEAKLASHWASRASLEASFLWRKRTILIFSRNQGPAVHCVRTPCRDVYIQHMQQHAASGSPQSNKPYHIPASSHVKSFGSPARRPY
jgi:hypothetical protein